MADQEERSSKGVGFIGLLTLLFIGLKLTGHIGWSWWYVLAPLWAPMAVVLGLCGIAVCVVILFVLFITITDRNIPYPPN
jgi:hypothetical protein